MSGKIIFMRHGDTYQESNNFNLTVAEASEKIILSYIGTKQAREASLKIFCNIDVILTSNALRTIQTAEIIKKNMPNAEIVIDERLHPWNSGTQDWCEYWNRYSRFIHENGIKKKYDTWESKEELVKRLQDVLNDYLDKNILVIAHSVLLASYLNLQTLKCGELYEVK